VPYNLMAHMMTNNSDLIDHFIVSHCSEVEGTKQNVLKTHMGKNKMSKCHVVSATAVALIPNS